VGLSRETACAALSLTFPFDHFFFLAALPPDDVGAAAFALAYESGLVKIHVEGIPMKKDESSYETPLRRNFLEWKNRTRSSRALETVGWQEFTHHCLGGPSMLGCVACVFGFPSVVACLVWLLLT